MDNPCTSMDYLWISRTLFVTKWHDPQVDRSSTKPNSIHFVRNIANAEICRCSLFAAVNFYMFKSVFLQEPSTSGAQFGGGWGHPKDFFASILSKWLSKKSRNHDTASLRVIPTKLGGIDAQSTPSHFLTLVSSKICLFLLLGASLGKLSKIMD